MAWLVLSLKALSWKGFMYEEPDIDFPVKLQKLSEKRIQSYRSGRRSCLTSLVLYYTIKDKK